MKGGLKDTSVIDDRIRIAREYKRAVGGLELPFDVFGDPPDEIVRVAEERAAHRQMKKKYERHWCIKKAKRHKPTNPTYGIVPKSKSFCVRSGNDSGGSVSFACAIDAAVYRNAVMAEKHPGCEILQIDLDAVWDRFGCACGQHERGSK